MISLFGYTFSALLPAVLVAIPFAVGFLVYIFRRTGQTKDNFVSTLFLLRELPRVLPARSRFVPPLQFWIELFAFLFLILAAAGLLATTAGQHIAIVVDDSLSMAAVDDTGESVLKNAISTASASIGEAISSTRFSVFTSGATLDRPSDIRVSGAEALKSLKAIKPRFEQDRLSTELDGLLASGDYDGIWLFTDHPVQRQQDSILPIKSPNLLSSSTREQRTNLWLSDISSRSQDGASSIQVTVNVASRTAIQARLAGGCYQINGSASNTAQIPTQNVEVADGSARVVNIGPLVGEWDYCEIRISPKEPSIRDSLDLDNTAWVTHSLPNNGLDLVSPLSPQELGLDKIRSLHVKALAPDAAASNPAIYHRSSLPREIRSPVLAVLPPPGPLPWGGAVQSKEFVLTQITRWFTSHPLTQYVNIPLLSIPSARVIECPDTSIPIISSTDGAIACAGERGGNRYIILGFELFPFDGLKSPTLSVFTLNCFRWLFQDISLGNQPHPLGVFLMPPDAKSADSLVPARTSLAPDVRNQILISEPGVIKFSRADSSMSSITAFSFSSQAESQIRQDVTITLPPTTTKAQTRSDASTPIYEYAAILALALLFFDILRRLRNRARWSIR